MDLTGANRANKTNESNTTKGETLSALLYD
jgi:hypothetical protein